MSSVEVEIIFASCVIPNTQTLLAECRVSETSYRRYVQ